MERTASDYEKLDKRMDYEEKGLPSGTIILWVSGLLIALLGVMAIMYCFVGVPQSVPRPDVVMNRKMLAPTLQSNPSRALHLFKEKQHEQLTTYGWVDKAQGTVRIPIDVAMDLAVKRGLYPRGQDAGKGGAGK